MVVLKKAVYFILVALFVNVLVVSAQSFDETFEHPDGDFAFDYDSDWDVELNDDDSVAVVSDDFILTISPPSIVADSDFADAADTDEMLDLIMELLADQVEFERPRGVDFDSGAVGTRVYFVLGSGSDAANGVVLTVELDGSLLYGIALSSVLESDEILDAITPLVETFRVGGGGPKPDDVDLELTAFNSRDDSSQWEEIIAELEDLELIGTRGELLTEEEFLSSDDIDGMETFRDTRTEDYQNFVIAAVITYDPADDESLFCGFLSNVSGSIDSEDQIPLLFVGASSGGTAVLLESGTGEDEVALFASEESYDWQDSLHVVMIVQDNVLTVFVDGQVAIYGYELSFLPEAGERVTAGVNLDQDCEMTGYFVYGLE